MILGRSNDALDAMGAELLSVSGSETRQAQFSDSALSNKRMRLMERMMKDTSVRTAV
jgi:hypothetical protein